MYGEPEVVPIQEDAKLNPTNPYGESKLLVEQMLAWLNRIHGLRYAALRYFNVAGAPEGPDGAITRGEAHEPETHLIPLVLDVALGRRKSIKIFGDDYPTAGRHLHPRLHPCLGPGRRAFTGARSSGKRAENGISEACNFRPLIYNLGNGKGFSVREVIESARRVTGHAIPVENQPRRAGRPGGAGGQFGKGDSRIGMETALYGAGRDHSHGVDLAQKRYAGVEISMERASRKRCAGPLQ